MRVAITLEQCWHKVPGGSARAAIGTARAIDTLGLADLVGVAATHRNPAPTEWAPPVTVRHLPLPRPALYELWHAVRWPRVELATGRVDVVHATAIAVPGARAPIVVSIYDLAFLDDPSASTPRGLRFFRRGTELAKRHAALVLCPSQATIDDCVRAGFDRARLRYVPLAADIEPVTPGDVDAARRRHGLERPYVLFTGTVEPRKNLPRLVDAFRRLDRDDVELVLAGPAGWLEDASALLRGLDGRARQIGFVPKVELDALYAGAAAFCYPSIREGFGLPVLEAMAQGAAVVTSATTSTAEVAGDAALTVDPLDVDAIARAIERLLDDAPLAARLREAARARASQFSWEHTARLTVEAYHEAAA